jgi:hypothetical protein
MNKVFRFDDQQFEASIHIYINHYVCTGVHISKSLEQKHKILGIVFYFLIRMSDLMQLKGLFSTVK